jgi:hypothetical protein
MSDLLPQLRRLLSDETGSGWPLPQEYKQYIKPGGFGLWVFTAFAVGLVAFFGVCAAAFLIHVRAPPREVTFSSLPVAPMPAPPNKPSPSPTIDELVRFVNTVTLPPAVMGTRSVPNITLHPEPAAHRIAPRGVYRPAPWRVIIPEPQSGYIGCPPSVCSPVERNSR